MKLLSPMKIIGLLLVCVIAFSSCNNDEIEDLEKRIEELEAQLSVKDTVLLSDLEISSQESMNIMAGRGITNILGTLFIRNCVDLTPLMGLRSVEGLYIDIPVGLNSLNGLNELTGVNYLDLYFNGNSNVDLSALDGLETINNISLSGALPNISWFNQITSLESINIYGESSSLDFSGFESLESVGYLSIYNWQGDLNIDGFENLTTINNLSMYGNSLTLSGFNNVQYLYNLDISGETLNFSGLNGILSLDYLYIGGNTLNLSGLNGLINLSHLSIYSGTLDISGLDNLKTIKSLEVMADNSATGLNNLETVTEYLSLGVGSYNNFLTGLIFAGSLNLYSFSQTGNIKSFSDLGFTSLERIGGLSLDIPTMESLDGFDFSSSNLEEFGIYNCPVLSDITALSTYSGSINFFGLFDTALTSLDGLENVTQITEMTVINNRQLDDWCAIKNIFDATPGNQRNISGNLLNPTSSEDITGCEEPGS